MITPVSSVESNTNSIALNQASSDTSVNLSTAYGATTTTATNNNYSTRNQHTVSKKTNNMISNDKKYDIFNTSIKDLERIFNFKIKLFDNKLSSTSSSLLSSPEHPNTNKYYKNQIPRSLQLSIAAVNNKADINNIVLRNNNNFKNQQCQQSQISELDQDLNLKLNEVKLKRSRIRQLEHENVKRIKFSKHYKNVHASNNGYDNDNSVDVTASSSIRNTNYTRLSLEFLDDFELFEFQDEIDQLAKEISDCSYVYPLF